MTFGGSGDDIARDRNGRPILDRYGRPVRKRRPTEPPRQRMPRRDEPRREVPRTRYESRAERPRQYIPPAQPRSVARPEASVAPPRTPRPPRREATVPRAPRKRRSFKPRGCLGSLGFLLLAFVVLVVSAFLWADTKLNRVDALPAQQLADTSGTNWLLVGSDSRQGLSQKDIDELQTGGDIGIGRTDTIMLLHIPNGGKATLLSIPRDSYVSIPGYGQDKINAAFTFGGPTLLTQTVEQATGLKIDHYAEVGFGGFSGMVDAVGGVDICVQDPIDDEVINLHLNTGCQKMNGPTALSFVRTRATPMGDLDRVERQRQFFAALMDKATAPSTMLNPFRSIPLIAKTGSTFTVGKKDHAWHLARVALALRTGVNTETVPVGGFADYDVGSVVLWDDQAAEALFSSMR